MRRRGDDRRDSARDRTRWLACLLVVAPAGGVVLDPFVGSGSTLIAARDIGRRAIGIERDEAHCETCARRLAQNILDFGGVA